MCHRAGTCRRISPSASAPSPATAVLIGPRYSNARAPSVPASNAVGTNAGSTYQGSLVCTAQAAPSATASHTIQRLVAGLIDLHRLAALASAPRTVRLPTAAMVSATPG